MIQDCVVCERGGLDHECFECEGRGCVEYSEDSLKKGYLILLTD